MRRHAATHWTAVQARDKFPARIVTQSEPPP